MSSSSSSNLPLWMKYYAAPKKKDIEKEKLLRQKLTEPEPTFSEKLESADLLICFQFWQTAEFSEKLLLKAEKEEIVIGLDVDWPGGYKTVLSKTTQIHVVYGQNKCAVLKVSESKNLPKALTTLLKHPNVKLAGYSLSDDIVKLGKDFSFDVNPILEKVNCAVYLLEEKLYCRHNWDLPSASEKLKKKEVAECRPPAVKRRLFRFPGRLRYSNQLSTCGAAAEELLELAENYIGGKKLILGFDLEWPFTFTTGSGKVALVQICPDQHLCYLLHIPKLNCLPKTLVLLLNHKNIRLVGVNIANDIRKIGRDFKIETKNILENNLVELGTLANKVLNVSEQWSLDRLVLHLLGMELEKPVNVRCSDWAQESLSQHQLSYAAADAYAGLAVYNHLIALQATCR